MSSAISHCRNVLGAVLPKKNEFLDYVVERLTPDHFPDPILKNIFILLDHYAATTGSVLTKQAVGDQLRRKGADEGTVLNYLETYDALASLEVSDDAFTWSLEQVRDLAAERQTTQALTEGMEILKRGLEGTKGQKYRGHVDARAHVLERFADIDRSLVIEESPEGELKEDADQIWQDYLESENNKNSNEGKVLFGLPDLDNVIGGLQPGELDLIIGGPGGGKTSLCVSTAWNVSINQGLNVVYATTETIRKQVNRKLICRHSKLEKFGLEDGINSKSLREGTLTDEERNALPSILSDIKNNKDYGKLYVVQIPKDATLTTLESRLNRLQRLFSIDLVVMDYLALLKSSRKRQSSHEEQSLILREAKQLATSFNKGRGIPLLSPWQVSRSARDQADKLGFYTLSSLAETDEAPRSADIVISVLEPSEREGRHAELKVSCLKQRDGEQVQSIFVRADFATSFFDIKSEGLDSSNFVDF